MKKSNYKYILISFLIIVSIFFAFFTSIEFLLNFTNDDSFFYLKIAYNFSTGEGSTFDLVNKTNGYHPLWFMILSAYFFILNLFTSFTPELYFRFVVLLICFVSILNLIVLNRFFESSYPIIAEKQFILIIPLFLTLVAIRDYGMETHITCLLITFYLLIKSTEIRENKSMLRLKCLLIVLLYLARVDFLLNVIPIIILSDFLISPKALGKKFLLYSSLSLITIVVLYSASNYFFFGGISPITGRIKNTFPNPIFLFNIERLLEPGSFTNQFIKFVFVIFVLLVFLGLISLKKYRSKFQKIDFLLSAICLSALLYMFTNLLFNTHSLKEWYVAFPAFVSSLLLVRMILLFPIAYKPSLVIFTVIFVTYFLVTRIKNPKWDSNYYYALEVKKNIKKEDSIFMIDLSGIIGYFSERKVINGDGLANSHEYWDYKTANNLGEYFRIKDIKYYSTYSTRKGSQKLNERLGYYNDDYFASVFGGYPFKFPSESLVLKVPYYFSHAVNSDTGFWYLFKLN